MLAWIFARCGGDAAAVETPIGYVPVLGEDGIDMEGLGASSEDMDRLLAIDPAEWTATLDQVRGHFARFGDKLPAEFVRMLDAFEARLAG